MRTKKILFVTTQFNTVVSGPGRFSSYLKNINFDNQVEISFLTDDWNIKNSATKNFYKVPKIPLLNKIPGYWIIRYFLFGIYISKISKTHHFDLVLGNSAYELLFLGSKKKDTIYIAMLNDYNYCEALQNFNFKYFQKSLSRVLGYLIEKHVINKVDKILVNSLYMKNHLNLFYPKLTKKEVIIFYKGVDLTKFTFTKLPTEINKFLFVKNDWKRGGLESIIKGFSKLQWQNDISLTIAGIQNKKDQGEITDIYKKFNCKFKIIILNLQDQKQIIDLYNSHDVYIMLSKSEALGVSLMEAMSCGLPIISTNVGGIPEVLDFGKAGYMLNFDNEIDSELSRLLNQLKENPIELFEKRDYGLKHVEKFDVKHLKNNLINIANEN